MINTYVCFEVRFEVMQQALKRSLHGFGEGATVTPKDEE
jgi:hypothetical protein